MPVEDSATLWTDAVEHHVNGRLDAAEALYHRILAEEPDHADALHLLGVLQYQLGQGQAGLALLDRAIAVNGRAAAYHGHRGLILADLDRLDEAIVAYRQALEIESGRSEIWNNLGNALRARGDLPGAMAAYREALAAQPDLAEAAANLGGTLLSMGAFADAVPVLERALELRPEDRATVESLSVAYNNLGAMLLHQGEAQQALDAFHKALARLPESFEAYLNTGKALAQLNRNEEAIDSYRQAIALDPNRAETYNDLGLALERQGQLEEAIRSYREALRLQPDYAQACNNLGNALRARGQMEESIASYRQALQIAPEDAEVWNNLGSALAAHGDLEAALEALEKATGIDPDLSEAHNNLGNAYKDLGDLDAALACYARAIAVCPSNQDAQSNRLYTLYFHPRFSLQAISQQHAGWSEQHAAPFYPVKPTFENDLSPQRRLRVGYVAPFFREHCQSFFTVPLLSQHEHSQVEVFVYSDVATPDRVTMLLRGFCDVWRNIAGMTDQAAADLIRADQIDILVDLSLHMAGNRMLMFARRPAPVQVTWLGYPGTTGLKTIDYRLTDPYLDPPQGRNDVWYAEKSLRLPHTFWCYDPLAAEPAVNDLPALRNGYVTFGCLNNFCKINIETLRLWAAVLRAVPASRLLLLTPEGRARRWVRDELQKEGVDAGRVEFTDRLPRSEYLKLYHRIDLGLDTIPYNGHTTSLDSLWMGVPVVTLVGEAPVGRAGWSQLCNLGLRDPAADSEAQFVQRAVELSADHATLARWRTELRSRLLRSPLGDAGRFARDIEAAYRQMWETFCASAVSDASNPS